MFVVCGEALMDVYVGATTTTGMSLDARVGGSPFNVAIGLARLGRPVAFLGGISTDAFGDRLLHALAAEGVDTGLVLRCDAPSTLSVVGLDAQGVPHYAFHGQGAADRQLTAATLPALPDAARALQFGSFAMVVSPSGAALRALAAREQGRRLVAYDPNVRLNVVPDPAVWRAAVAEMAGLAHLLKISDEDLAVLYPGRAAGDLAREWLGQGVQLVVVTRGGHGSEAWNLGNHVQVPAAQVAVVDTVGAGDTYQAALLAWLDEHGCLVPRALAGLSTEQLAQALGFASTAAAVTCGRRGADPPRRIELPR